jgi:hypothetical protein
MHEISVDDEVYALLTSYTRERGEINEVLRSILELDDGQTRPTTAPLVPDERTTTVLKVLLRRGVISGGDTLVSRYDPKVVHEAVVADDGWLTTEVRRYQSPTTALSELVGSHVNGWANWVHLATGKTLRQLRDENEHLL